jgi:vancomycin resistance protein YoaR
MTTDTQSLPVTSRTSGFRWRRFLIAFLATLVVLLVIAAIGTYAYASSNAGRILSGVSIGGVSVAGLSPADAKQKLQSSLPNVAAGALTVKAGTVEQKIAYSDLGRSYNIDATVDQAMNVGRTGNPLEQLGDQLRTMSTGVNLVPTVSYDANALEQRVAQVVAAAQVTPADASIQFQNGDYVVTPATDGQQVNGDDALREAIAALNTDGTADTSIDVPATTVSAAITTPTAQAAVTQLQSVTTDPLVLSVGSTSHTIDSATLREWVRLNETAPGQWSLVVDRAPIDQLVATLKAQVDQPPVEAEFKFDNGHAVTVPGATGYEVDATASGDAIYNALVGRSTGTPATQVVLPVATTLPKLTTEQAQAMVSQVKLLGTWTTHYIPSTFNNMGINIRRPADLINGTVVDAGAEFSFVGVAGPITVANGYGDGAAIIHGKTRGEGVLGGGLCSASTTMFNAALRAGFELGARRNHAYYIDRYPVGLDATIWISGNYTQDMSFTNDSAYPILIRGINKKRSVTFEIWGIPDGRTVSLSDPIVTNKQPATEYYEFTDSLPPRVVKEVEFKADGFNSVVTRTVRDANGNVIHQDTLQSSYRKVDGVYLVGRYPGDPPAGYQWPKSQGIPPAPGPRTTPTPSDAPASHTPKPSTQPTATPKPSHTPKATSTDAPTATPTDTATPS